MIGASGAIGITTHGDTTLDDRERRQRRKEFEVDDALALDIPVWYLRMTQRFRLSWRREAFAVFALGAGFALLGFVVGRVTA